MVIYVAAVALFVDVATVLLLTGLGKRSVNVRAAALHNLSDALASVEVIVVGIGVLLWNLDLLDILVTLVIAGYTLWQSFGMLKLTIGILMESVPADLDISHVSTLLSGVPGVIDVHHLHVWQLDEHDRAFEGHVVMAAAELTEMERIKRQIKQIL